MISDNENGIGVLFRVSLDIHPALKNGHPIPLVSSYKNMGQDFLVYLWGLQVKNEVRKCNCVGVQDLMSKDRTV